MLLYFASGETKSWIVFLMSSSVFLVCIAAVCEPVNNNLIHGDYVCNRSAHHILSFSSLERR
jgi:hypothetical protein